LLGYILIESTTIGDVIALEISKHIRAIRTDTKDTYYKEIHLTVVI